MPDEVVEAVLSVLERTDIPTLDITGGAPELHPSFREIVTRARDLGRHVIDRCNLTILTVPRFADLPEFLAENQVEIVASPPHYSPSQTDAQRGGGIYEKSILALRRLNDLGYGKEGTGLRQPNCGRVGDVQVHPLCGLGWGPLRLRLQPDAGSAVNGRGPPNDPGVR